jgi:addiction module RelE/StbE family toxin
MTDIQFKYEWDSFSLAHTTSVLTQSRDSTEKWGQREGQIGKNFPSGEPLDPMHRDHKLLGSLGGRRDCHIESDWLLIDRIEGNQFIFERIGAHSDLFRK